MYVLVIATQAVDGSLLLIRRGLDNNIRLSRGRRVSRRGSTPILPSLGTSEAARATEEDGHLVVEDLLARLGHSRRDAVLEDGRAALVDHLE